MFKKTKTIKFLAEEYADNYIEYPIPAKSAIPDWYKKAPRYVNNGSHPRLIDKKISKNTTYKSCMPLRDALTMGYIWCLPVDIQITKKNGDYDVYWSALNDVVSIHSKDQVPFLPNLKYNENTNIFKFNFRFLVKTPKGYSVLYTQPFNRHDLPFTIFSGVIESDSYELEVNFPFQLNVDLQEDEVLIIEKGTPVVQFVPIKRESWKHKKELITDPYRIQKVFNEINGKIIHAYRSLYWIKKNYD